MAMFNYTDTYYRAGNMLIRERVDSDGFSTWWSYFNEFAGHMIFTQHLAEDIAKARRNKTLAVLSEQEWADEVEAARKSVKDAQG